MPTTRRTTSYLTDEAVILHELREALGIDDVILFGHSDGGSIALIAAAMRQPGVRAIITEGAHVFVEEATLAGVREARAELETTDLAARLARYHGDRVPALTSAWIDTWLSPEFRDWNVTSLLPNATCPALVVQGSADEFGTAEQVRAIVDGMAGRASALLLPGAGHTPHRDARDAVLDASATFIAGVVPLPRTPRAGGSRTRVRVATPDDVETLFDIRTSVRENHQGREELATLGVTPASVREALATTARAWIADDVDGESLGFAMADASVGTLFALFVRPQAERRGVGRALLDVAESWLFSKGWREIWLLTGVDPSLRAHGVYRAAGWLPGGVEDGQVRYTKRSG